MSTRNRQPGAKALVAALVFLMLLPVRPLLGQDSALHRLLPEAEEIRLARSAAPAALADSADVYVLRRGGHVKVVSGTTGAACLVARDHLESLYPICYDAAAAATVLQAELLAQRLRERGIWGDSARIELQRAFDSGELRAPAAVAVAYMMSPHQVIYAGEAGPRVGRWHPHVMVYGPGLTPESLGFRGAPDGNFQVGDETGRTPFLTIFTHWTTRPADDAGQ